MNTQGSKEVFWIWYLSIRVIVTRVFNDNCIVI